MHESLSTAARRELRELFDGGDVAVAAIEFWTSLVRQ